MMTPLPAQSPSALTTMGAFNERIKSLATPKSSVFKNFAVFIWCLCKNSFIKAFELSSCAAAFVGPNIAKFAFSKLSTTPRAKKSSLPTIHKSIFSAFAKAVSSLMSVKFTFVPSLLVAPLPGAKKNSALSSSRLIAKAMENSRAPLPKIKIFIEICSKMMNF